MEPVKIKIGLVGLGFGQTVHLPVWQSLPGVQVTAVADSDLKKAQAAGIQYGIKNVYDSCQKLFDSGLDAVSLALPPQENPAVCRQALDHGLHVFCEKPLAASLTAAETLRTHLRDRILMIDFEFMESDVFQKLKGLISQGAIGEIQHFSITWLTHSAAQRQRQWGWKTDSVQGGGVAALLGSHSFFIIEQLFGKIVKITADLDHRVTSSFTPPEQEAADDLAHIFLEMEGGVKGAVVLSNASKGSSVHRWEVIGEKGTLLMQNNTLDPLIGFSLQSSQGEAQWVNLYDSPFKTQTDSRQLAFKILAQRFVGAISKQNNAWPDFQAGLRVQEIMSAVYRSAKEHWPINL